MFTFTRSVQFKSVAAGMAAGPVCGQIVAHMNQELGFDARMMRPIMGGHPARLLFVSTADSLQKVKDQIDRSLQDAKFRELVVKLGEFTDGAMTVDQLWQDA